jgi:hypothetical protein
VTGDYTFRTFASGNLQLTVNNQVVIDHWRQGWLPNEELARVRLTAGQAVPVHLRWDSDIAVNIVRLLWKPPVTSPTTSLWSKVGDGIDYWFVYGPELDHVVAGYRQLTGQAPMMPLWAYGQAKGKKSNINDALGTSLPDPLSAHLILASIGNIATWEFVGYNMLIFYSALRVIPAELYEAAEIDGAGQYRIIRAVKLPALRGALVIATIFSVIGSFQLFTEPSILQGTLAPNAITTYFTPNLYAYSLSFRGQQYNYAAAVAIVMGVITMIIAYVVQLRGMRRED